jgi:hypothetical protein
MFQYQAWHQSNILRRRGPFSSETLVPHRIQSQMDAISVSVSKDMVSQFGNLLSTTLHDESSIVVFQMAAMSACARKVMVSILSNTSHDILSSSMFPMQ